MPGMRMSSQLMFDVLRAAVDARPEASITYSQAASPRLGDFLPDLDAGLSLDWSGESFRGLQALRERIVAAHELGPACSPDDVLVTSGAAEANFLALSQVIRPGGEIVVDEPGWPQPLVVAPALGAGVVRVARDPATWRLDVDSFLAAIGPRTQAVFLANPANPAGEALAGDALRAIAARAEDAGAWFVCDEAYAGLEWNCGRVTAAATLSPRAITTGSVSKALGLQGLRIGWLVCRDRALVEQAIVAREYTSEIMNVLGEHVAAVALRPDRYGPALERARAAGQAGLDLLDTFVSGRADLSWSRPPAGLVGLCRLESGLDDVDLARRLLAPPYRTFVLPGTAFGAPGTVRLGAGGDDPEGLALGLERFGALLDTAGTG